MVKRRSSDDKRQFWFGALSESTHLESKGICRENNVRGAHFPFADAKAEAIGRMDLFDGGIFDNQCAETVR